MSSSDDDPFPQPSNTTTLALVPYNPASFSHLLLRLKANLKQDGIQLRQKRFAIATGVAIATAFTAFTSIFKSKAEKRERARIAKENAEMMTKLNETYKELNETRKKLYNMGLELQEARKAAAENQVAIVKNNEAIQENKRLIDQNNANLARNAAALSSFDNTLENQYTASTGELNTITQQLDQVLFSMEEARVEIDADIRSVQEAITHEIDSGVLDPIISHLKNFFAYFIDEMKRVNEMPVCGRVAKLEDVDDFIEVLENSRLPDKGTLHNLLSDIISGGYAMPKGAQDQMAPVMLDMLIYGTQIFALIEVFLLQQYQFLAQVYLKQVDLVAYNEKIQKMMNTYTDFSTTLLFGENAIFKRVKEVLNKIVELDFVQSQMKELFEMCKESMVNLDKIHKALVEMGGSIEENLKKPEFNPEFSFGDKRRGFERISKVKTESSGWSSAKKVSYAMQFFDAKSGIGSVVSDWVDIDMENKKHANPVISAIPLDAQGGRFRLIYRKFDDGPAQLVANLTDHSATSFRDLDRDLFNAILEPNEEIALAELGVYLHRANVNASFEHNKRALHVALENANYEVFGKLVKARAGLDIQDVDGRSPILIATQSNAFGVVKAMIELGANPNIKAGPAALEVTPLHSAIVKNHSELIRYLISSPRVDLNTPAQNGLSPLHYAASLDRVDVVKWLLAQGKRMSINARSKQNYTALHMAAISNSARVALALLETKRMDINAPATNGVTPLHLAGLYGANDTAVLLLEFGANVAARTRNGSIPLHYAADHGHPQIVSLLAKRSAKLVNALNNQEMSPLYMAMQSNRTQAADILLKNSAQLWLRLSEHNKTMLHLAVINGDTVATVNLIKAGLEVNVVDSRGFTPLHYAVFTGKLETAKVLLNHGADVNARNKRGQTALHLAAFLDDQQVESMLQLLFSHQADIEAQEKTARLTPLHLAAQSGNGLMANFLIEEDANLEATDPLGQTPFHLAVRSAQLNIMQLLRDRSANVEHKNERGETALHVAARYGSKDTVAKLLELGANIGARSKDGSIPLHYAVERGHLQIVSLLVKADRLHEFINAYNNEDMSPLYIAIRDKHSQIIDLLRKNCAKLDLRMSHDNTMLHLAVIHGDIEMVNYLIKAGLDVNLENKEPTRYYTPLHYAVLKGNLEMAKVLLAKGATIRTINFKAYTEQALMNEIISLNEELALKMLQLLVRHKADVNAVAERERKTPLYLAAEKGYYKVVKFLLEAGANANNGGVWQNSPLYIAAKSGHLNIVKLLADVGKADINAHKKYGDHTPLMAAVNGKGTFEMYKWFVDEKKVNTWVQDRKKLSLLHFAARTNKKEIIHDLIKVRRYWDYLYRDSYSAPIEEGNRIAHYAAYYANVELLEFIVSEHWLEQFKTENDKGEWPLASYLRGNGSLEVYKKYFFNEHHCNRLMIRQSPYYNRYNDFKQPTLVAYAAKLNRTEFVAFLLEKGMGYNMQWERRSGMHWAAWNNNREMIKLLVKKGAFIVDLFRIGGTVDNAILGHGDLSLVKYLFEMGEKAKVRKEEPEGFAHVFARVYHHYSLADAAIRANKTDIALFLSGEKSIGFKDDDGGQTPLHVTAFWNNLPMVKYFLEKKGLKVDQKDHKGQTALYKAIDGHGQLEMVRFLVEQHKASLATLDAKTTNSYVYQAMLRKKNDIAKWLVERGADIDSVGKEGFSPLHLAVSTANVEMFRFLMAHNVDTKKELYRRTAIEWAMTRGLLRHGDNDVEPILRVIVSEYRKADGQTLLHEVLLGNRAANVDFFLRRGVSPNVRNKHNQTLLHLAGQQHNNRRIIPVVELLAKQKCIDLQAKSNGKTAKDWAKLNNFGRMINILDNAEKRLNRKSRSVPLGTSEAFNPFTSQVDVNGTMLLADLIARKVTGEKYFCTDSDSVVSQSDVRSFALNLSEAFEAMLRTVSAKFKLSYHGFDSFQLYKNLQSAACSGQWAAVERTLSEVGRGALAVEKGSEAGRYLAVQIDRLLVEVPVKGGRRRAK